jgi:flagellar motor switch protein FliM
MMGVFSPEEIEEAAKTAKKAGNQKADGKHWSVRACDFRSAGRLSNENARSLMAIQETFAQRLASAMDAYLGTGLEVKMQAVDQLPVKEHIASIPSLSYIVPFSLTTVATTMIMEYDINLVFPIIELLLGGTGTSLLDARELSEIEEEIMQDVTSLIARQAESAWRMPSMSLVPNRRIKSSLLHQYCPPNEKLTSVKFEIEIAGITGSLQLVFPSSFVTVLIKQFKLDHPQRKGGSRYFPTPGIRERILDCDFVVTAGVPSMKVAVRDLVALQPGCVLKLRAPVRTPGMLTVEGMEIFEAAPVRNGTQKAAQLGRRVHPTGWGKE